MYISKSVQSLPNISGCREQYGNSLLQDRVLFATDDMIPWQRCVDELKALPLKDKVKEKWLGLNAKALLGI